MDINGTSACAGKDEALSCVAQSVNILLVDHDTTSLMSVASQLEHQLYKVTTTESATAALLLFQKYYYDIVIIDTCMPDMEISMFLEKLHVHRMAIPVILIADDSEMKLVMEALGKQVCYIFSKPPSYLNISTVWHHIRRVTGNMPSLSEKTKHVDIEGNCNPSSVVINQKQKNLKINSNKENMKRKQNQIAETSNAASGHSKKPRLTWNPNLHQKFLQAISVLGEHGARPKTLLSLMKEPNLTVRHVSSHLQKYRKQKEKSLNLEKEEPLNLQKRASSVMPTLFPTTKINDTVSSNTTATPNSVQVQNQDNFNYSGNNNVNTIVNNDAFENPENLEEGANTFHQQFDEMPSVDDVNQCIQELEASGFNIWDVIN